MESFLIATGDIIVLRGVLASQSRLIYAKSKNGFPAKKVVPKSLC